MRALRLAVVVAAVVVLLGASSPQVWAVELDLNLAVGADFAGELDLGAVNLDAGTGYSLGLELAFDVPLIELGVGLEYGFAREAEASDIDAHYYQLYAIGRFYFGPLYLAGRLGVADVSLPAELEGDSSGGSWALGGGIELFETVKLELFFSQLGSDLGYEGWAMRLLYTF